MEVLNIIVGLLCAIFIIVFWSVLKDTTDDFNYWERDDILDMFVLNPGVVFIELLFLGALWFYFRFYILEGIV